MSENATGEGTRQKDRGRSPEESEEVVHEEVRTGPNPIIVCICVFVGVALRLLLALRTYGSNDVMYWQQFMETIVSHDSVVIYSMIPYYNHPPLMSGYLWLVSFLVPYSPNGFPFLIKLPALLSDIGSLWLVYRLVSHLWTTRSARLAVCAVALNPVLISVTGFHGNTDPVFAFFVLLAAERLVLGRNHLLAGAILGLSMNIKIVPIITFPAFFFWFRSWKDRFTFFIPAGLVVLSGFAYHLWNAFGPMNRNIFDYTGLTGIWGITQVFTVLHLGAPEALYEVFGKYLVLLALLFLAWRELAYFSPSNRERALLVGLASTFLGFLVLTPGFGVQYLAWLAVPGVFLGLRGYCGYGVVAGVFLMLVYTFWNQGIPWHFAYSDVVGPWRGGNSVLCFLTWLYLVVWASMTATNRWGVQDSLV